MTPMSQNQPQGSTFPLRAHPRCRLQAADRSALSALLLGIRTDLKVLDDTAFSIRRLHQSIAAP
jgi:hypothetical protein